MLVRLREDLEEQVLGRDYTVDSLVTVLRGRVPGAKFNQLKPVSNQLPAGEPQVNFMEMMTRAYSLHRAVTIAPHDLWYVVLCEVAATVNADSDRYRALFTSSPAKLTIAVDTAADVTHLPLEQVMVHLRRLVPSDVDLFIPEFTTHTPASRTACYAAFADAVKSYYSYMTLACGLPAVRIAGTAEDWRRFAQCARGVGALMGPLAQPAGSSLSEDTLTTGEITRAAVTAALMQRRPKVSPGVSAPYFERVAARAEMLAAVVAGEDENPQWIQDVYMHQNVGSGGEKDVTGWLTEFYTCASKRVDSFQPCLSVVPYTNGDTGREFTAVFGCFANAAVPGQGGAAREARYGHVVFEHVAEQPGGIYVGSISAEQIR